DVVQGPVRVPDLGAGNTAYSSTMGLILVNNDVGFNDLWYTFRNTGRLYIPEDSDQRWSGEAPQASYAASLDKGLQDLTYLPIRDGDDAWEVIQDVAGAEFGSAFWDEKGVFRFWNAHRIRDLQTKVVRRLTLDEVSGLQVTNSLDSVRNIWSVDAGRKKAVYGTVYESRDPDEFLTPAGSIRTFRVWSENVVAPDPFLVRRRSTMGSGTDYPNYQWDDEETHTYVVQFLINGKWIQKESGTQGVSGVDIRCMYTDTGELLLRVANGHPYPVRFARREDNIPSLRIGGVVVEDFPNNVITEEDQESSAKYGPRNLKLSGDWVQERLRISEVDEFLKSRTVEPIP